MGSVRAGVIPEIRLPGGNERLSAGRGSVPFMAFDKRKDIYG